jgi:hypothetical protein
LRNAMRSAASSRKGARRRGKEHRHGGQRHSTAPQTIV